MSPTKFAIRPIRERKWSLLPTIAEHFQNLAENTLWNSLCEKLGDSSHARRYKTASWPDEAYVSGVAHEFVENGDDVGMPEIIGKGDLGKPADSHAG